MSQAAGIIFSNLNDNNLSRLTVDRTVAAIPFGCRYRLVDFALSNMVNAGITNISLVANYNYRSLTEHVGSGKDWDLARRVGGIKLVSPFQNALTSNTSLYSYHLDALKNMQQLITEIKEPNVVLSDTDNICNIDLSAAILEHEKRGADMTLVTTPCDPAFTSKGKSMMVSADEDGKIRKIVKSDRQVPGYDRMINIYIVRTSYLCTMLSEAFANNYHSMSEDILMVGTANKRYYVHRFGGFVAPVSSLRDYFSHSIALATDPAVRAALIEVEERPIYTKVHNSAPTVFRTGSSAKNSLIADGCIIEGTVENSVLFRGVHVERGAVVRNSVLFGNCLVEEGADVNCILADKSVRILPGTHLSGAPSLPFFIDKDRKV